MYVWSAVGRIAGEHGQDIAIVLYGRGEIVEPARLQAVGNARNPAFWHNRAMLTWQPVSNHEIEQTRQRRQVQRLEQRLTYLRKGNSVLHADDIVALERELATLRNQTV